MNEETSRMIVALVLIIAIVISSYLTFVAFKYRSTFSEEPRVRNTVQSAEITLNVLPPGPNGAVEGSIEESGVG